MTCYDNRPTSLGVAPCLSLMAPRLAPESAPALPAAHDLQPGPAPASAPGSDSSSGRSYKHGAPLRRCDPDCLTVTISVRWPETGRRLLLAALCPSKRQNYWSCGPAEGKLT